MAVGTALDLQAHVLIGVCGSRKHSLTTSTRTNWCVWQSQQQFNYNTKSEELKGELLDALEMGGGWGLTEPTSCSSAALLSATHQGGGEKDRERQREGVESAKL